MKTSYQGGRAISCIGSVARFTARRKGQQAALVNEEHMLPVALPGWEDFARIENAQRIKRRLNPPHRLYLGTAQVAL